MTLKRIPAGVPPAADPHGVGNLVELVLLALGLPLVMGGEDTTITPKQAAPLSLGRGLPLGTMADPALVA